MRYVVVFDIPDDRTRKRVGDELEAYGSRVQRSVFEVSFRTATEFRNLRAAVAELIDPQADSVRFYRQCESCAAKAFELGAFSEPFDDGGIFFF